MIFIFQCEGIQLRGLGKIKNRKLYLMSSGLLSRCGGTIQRHRHRYSNT